jgi:hypothetical protein
MGLRGKLVCRLALLGLPLLTALLWIASGREVFSKSGKAAQVAVRDALFGDTTVQTQFVPGPIFGWYIGLDLVAVVALVCLAAGSAWWWLARRRRALEPSGGSKP